MLSQEAAAGSGDPYITTPKDFSARIRADYERYGTVIKTSGCVVIGIPGVTTHGAAFQLVSFCIFCDEFDWSRPAAIEFSFRLFPQCQRTFALIVRTVGVPASQVS